MTEEQKAKRREINRKWRLANPDKVKAANLKWRQANPDKVKAASHKWYQAHTKKSVVETAKPESV